MSAYITLENGLVVTYNNAHWIQWSGGPGYYAKLYKEDPDKNPKGMVASVPTGAIVSFYKPCAVDAHQITSAQALRVMLENVLASVEGMEDWSDRRTIGKLKKKLANFNAKTNGWKS